MNEEGKKEREAIRAWESLLRIICFFACLEVVSLSESQSLLSYRTRNNYHGIWQQVQGTYVYGYICMQACKLLVCSGKKEQSVKRRVLTELAIISALWRRVRILGVVVGWMDGWMDGCPSCVRRYECMYSMYPRCCWSPGRLYIEICCRRPRMNLNLSFSPLSLFSPL